MKMLRYFFIPFNPKGPIRQLLEDARKTTYSMIDLGTIGGLFTIAVYVGYRNGFGAVVRPFLSIPPERYSLWEIFLCIPAFITTAVVFTGFARLIAGDGISGSNRPFGLDWAIEAGVLFKKLIDENRHEELIDYQSFGEAARLAVPTPKHYLPMLYAIALKEDHETIAYFNKNRSRGLSR